MKSARSLLVLLSACAYALAAPVASTRETSDPSGPHISAEAAGAPLTRNKKSAPGTCITVTEPYKAPFTICNDATASAASGFTHGGQGVSNNHAAGGGASSHTSGSGTSAHGVGLHGAHAAPTSAHFGNGGLFVPHQHVAGTTGPHIAVHPALHTAVSPNHVNSAAGYGLSGYGLPYGGQGFILNGGGNYGFLPNQFGLVPPYNSLSYGVSPIGLYRATDNNDIEEEFTKAFEPIAQKEETTAEEQASQSSENEREVVAAALEEELVAQGLEQVRATQLEAMRQMQLERTMEEAARSAVLAPLYAPLPAINNYLPSFPATAGVGGYSAGVFPPSAGGGGCGALPLLFSCSPQLLRGHLVPGGGVHYSSVAPWAIGPALHAAGGGGSYRQSVQQTGSARANPTMASNDAVEKKSTGSTKANNMKMKVEKDSPAENVQGTVKPQIENVGKSPKV